MNKVAKILILVLMFTLFTASVPTVYAVDAQQLMTEAQQDPIVKETTENMARPAFRIGGIFLTCFGLWILWLVFTVFGAEVGAMVKKGQVMSKGRIFTFGLGLAVGILFTGGSIFLAIGFLDDIVIKAFESLTQVNK